MHFYVDEKKTLGDSKAKISLRKHFRFLSRIMDYSRWFDCIIINVGKKRVGPKQPSTPHSRAGLTGCLADSRRLRRRCKYPYYSIIHFRVVQSLSGNESRVYRTL